MSEITKSTILDKIVNFLKPPVMRPGGDREEFVYTAWFFGLIVIAALLALVVGHWKPEIGASISWAIASSMTGCFLGFLFGVPKVLQNGEPGLEKKGAEASTYQQQVNTNLTDISDWITKIIVGLGLVHLHEVPKLLQRAGELIGAEIKSPEATQPAVAMGIAITVGFGLLGFLFAYLSTRMYVASALAKADRDALRAERKVESNTAQLDSIRAELNLLKGSLAAPSETKTVPPTTSAVPESSQNSDDSLQTSFLEAAQTQLRQMARSYCQIDDPDWAVRVRMKDEASDEMARFCVVHDIPKGWLASTAMASDQWNDGFIAAYATVVNSQPETEDLKRLLAVGEMAEWKHTRYRVTIAIGRIYSARLATSLPSNVATLLIRYFQEGDSSLRRNVRHVASLIQEMTGQVVMNLDTPPLS